MCCLIDSSWWTNQVISRCIQCSTTGVTKAVAYAILPVGWGIYRILAANQRVDYVAGVGFLSGYLPYIWHDITINKNVLSASLSKTFHSFSPSNPFHETFL